uniref:uncharacterized protein LOC122582472 n=1 Tax=Erigeron canadensis TaxID=72917 RepID=UPI001CB8C1D0|nr:uncharacterized protein LOC122582472 [Erigeron canadensis]
MAVVGLCKASVLDSCVGENMCPVARRCGSNNERSTTRTSYIRKMWRDLESEGRAREDGKQQMSGLLTGHDGPCLSSLEGESIASEDRSRDASEIENECPQTQNRSQNQMDFQNTKEDNEDLCLQHTPSLGVPEKERVRKLFHEWGSKSFEGHTLYSPRMSSCSRSQWPAQNECKRVRIVREWIESSTQLVDTCRTGLEESVAENGSPMGQVRDGIVDFGNCARSSIRRIYGRQALLDLLAKFVRERKREVDNLLDNRYVSNFGHRHRIQSLLKGRFLRNQRFVEDKKQTSVPASELGLLRQTQAVSEIRKGFLSKLNNYHQAAECAQSDSDTSSDNEMNYDRIKQADKTVKNVMTSTLTSNSESHSSLEYASLETLHHEERQTLPLAVNHAQSSSATSSDNRTKYEHIKEAKEIVDKIPDEICEELETNNLTIRWDASNPQIFTSTIDERCDHDESLERNQSIGNFDLSQGTLGTECTSGPLEEVYGSIVEEQETHESSVIEDDDDDIYAWHHLNRIESDEGVDVHLDEHEDGWYQETPRSDFQESQEWYENDNALEDSTEIWFGGASYLEAALADRSNAYYTSDDDNGRRVELTELSSRRRVSNLLESDFGARLDQLMQSYIERQDQAFESENGWIQDQDQQSLDQSGSDIEAVDTTEAVADRQISDSHEHVGNQEWEIINGLRLDMNTLQQRMDGMQKMLEACMNMQHELQRSVHQEVYSALHRFSNTGGACEDGIRNDQSEARSGMEGVCFLCCDDCPNRSAHMYICSKCAEKINWSKLKESVRHP